MAIKALSSSEAAVTSAVLSVASSPVVTTASSLLAASPPLSVTAAPTSSPIASLAVASVSQIRGLEEDEFVPYSIAVEFPEGKREYQINKPEDEEALVREVSSSLNQSHQSVKIEKDALNKRLEAALGKFCEIDKRFGITLHPKIESRTVRGDKETITFVSGAFETLLIAELDDPTKKQGCRFLSDGTIEKGRFWRNGFYNTAGELFRGYRCCNDQYTFRNPESLCGVGRQIFSVVTISGKKELRLLEPTEPDDFYVLSTESPVEVLIKAVKSPYGGDVITQVLTHPNNVFDPKAFLSVLLWQPSVLFTLLPNRLLSVLTLARDHSVAIDLLAVGPSGDTLFTCFVGKGYTQLVQLMFEMDPRVILDVKHLKRPLFTESLLKGNVDEMQWLLKVLSEHDISLQMPDQWIKRAFDNDCAFTDEGFRDLPPALKDLVFMVARFYDRTEFVARLVRLGMVPEKSIVVPPAIIGQNMDIGTVRTTLSQFLMRLRQQGSLMRREEFAKLDQSKYFEKRRGRRDICRILGRDFIEQTAVTLNCPTVKAPRKIVVLDDDRPITIRVDADLGFELMNGYTMYADLIPKAARLLSREEMVQFLNVLSAVGFSDFLGDNFFIAEEGVYIIDTEHRNFRGTPGLSPNALSWEDLMDTKDHEWFRAEVRQRVIHDDERRQKMSGEFLERERVRKADCEKFGFTEARTFTFPRETILG